MENVDRCPDSNHMQVIKQVLFSVSTGSEVITKGSFAARIWRTVDLSRMSTVLLDNRLYRCIGLFTYTA